MSRNTGGSFGTHSVRSSSHGYWNTHDVVTDRQKDGQMDGWNKITLAVHVHQGLIILLNRLLLTAYIHP